MELIFAICAIRLDLRRNKALNKNLFAGWLVEGISELPQVMVHRWQYGTLVKRARNLRAHCGRNSVSSEPWSCSSSSSSDDGGSDDEGASSMSI